MKVTVNKDGKIEFDLAELVESLPDEQRKLFYQHLAFQETLMVAAVETVATGACFEGDWWISTCAEKLRLKLVAAMPEAFQELARRLVEQRDGAKEESRKMRDIFNRLQQHWPREVQPNECHSTRPENCYCPWTQKQVDEMLAHELGDDWREQLQPAEANP